jgi:aminopeptidase
VSTAGFIEHVMSHDPSGETEALLQDWLLRPALPALPRPARR